MKISSSRVPLVSWKLAKSAESNEKAVGGSRGTHGAFHRRWKARWSEGRARPHVLTIFSIQPLHRCYTETTKPA